MKARSSLLRLLAPIVLLAVVAKAVPAVGGKTGPNVMGDSLRGAELYESRCTGCHSLDSNRVGPRHRGVFGRSAGKVADYAYSRALAMATLTWNEETLDRWLTNPQGLIPGQRMNVRVKDAQDRADLIAFLKQQSLGGEN